MADLTGKRTWIVDSEEVIELGLVLGRGWVLTGLDGTGLPLEAGYYRLVSNASNPKAELPGAFVEGLARFLSSGSKIPAMIIIDPEPGPRPWPR